MVKNSDLMCLYVDILGRWTEAAAGTRLIHLSLISEHNHLS